MSTHQHSQYWAHALTARGATDSVENLSRAISNARVDLNPHQVDAALFAVRSPLSRGVILADEVGLGKTIEAALVISQRWAERKRRILVVVPASLRKQWQQELEQKFFLPSVVLEASTWSRAQAEGRSNPFDAVDHILIVSYHFAANRREEVAAVPWDLVVIDEAHRLRNVYRPSSKLAKALVGAVEGRAKVLLTATPLQNSLMELYGLVSILDPHVFGDQASFREQFVRAPNEAGRNEALRLRLNDLCKRTLRKQVLEYVRFTKRIPLTQQFTPSDAEQRLYDEVSTYLQSDMLVALPSAQRMLMTMVLRKLLASSSFAISGTLRILLARLEGLQEEALEDAVAEDFEGLREDAEEWPASEAAPATDVRPDPELIAREIEALESCVALADGITDNAKGGALLRALATAFAKTAAIGAAKKAVVFTESRRTQEYLFRLLSEQGYAGQVVMINATNTDARSREIHAAWLSLHAGDGVPSGSRAVDIKAAVTDAFRDEATILIATEAAAEGVNLQFCSLVVNYDLPWNPQRIEQRIGRCHRYGQKHDVVVVNFLNQRNAADQRVLQLLSEKFRLFDGVFGASDEVLGALESGVDIERRIAEVYQTCRTPEEIAAAFDRLQAELEGEIQAQMSETRQAVLDNFDEDVHARLRVHRDQAMTALGQRERWLLNLTRVELASDATFDPAAPRFQYQGADTRSGWYHLDWREAERRGEHFWRVDHPFAETLIVRSKSRRLEPTAMTLDYRGHGAAVAALEPLLDEAGWLSLALLTVASLATEEFLVFAGQSDGGEVLDAERCERLLALRAHGATRHDGPAPNLTGILEHEVEKCLRTVEVRNGQWFDVEVAKLDRWSDDLKLGLERELKEIDAEIRETRRKSVVAVALSDKVERKLSTILRQPLAEFTESAWVEWVG